PKTINKKIHDLISATVENDENNDKAQTVIPKKMTKKERQKTIDNIEKEMKQAAKDLDFEKATELRDMLFELKAEG
ncbi:UvrB/UvrC motif-containing protein, partial [Staphylococcus aureus]|nr:UvrB/UvrC motif-containing protein [Staphylococcus aureus]